MAIGKSRIDAYKISPATVQANIFVASKGTLMFKLDPIGSPYKIYKVTEASSPDGSAVLEELDEIVAVEDQFVMSSVEVFSITGPTIFVAIPSDDNISMWPDPPTGSTTKKATVFKTKKVSLFAERFDTEGVPFNPSSGFNHGPESHYHKYGFRKMFFRVKRATGEEGVVWQDQDNKNMYVTWVTSTGHSTIELQNPHSYALLAAAGNSVGEIVYILVSFIIMLLV